MLVNKIKFCRIIWFFILTGIWVAGINGQAGSFQEKGSLYMVMFLASDYLLLHCKHSKMVSSEGVVDFFLAPTVECKIVPLF